LIVDYKSTVVICRLALLGARPNQVARSAGFLRGQVSAGARTLPTFLVLEPVFVLPADEIVFSLPSLLSKSGQLTAKSLKNRLVPLILIPNLRPTWKVSYTRPIFLCGTIVKQISIMSRTNCSTKKTKAGLQNSKILLIWKVRVSCPCPAGFIFSRRSTGCSEPRASASASPLDSAKTRGDPLPHGRGSERCSFTADTDTGSNFWF